MSTTALDAPDPPHVGPAGSLQFGFSGSGPLVMCLHLQNLFWTFLTGGVYYFWGKARLQAYVYSQIEAAGDRPAYFGQGRELFFGWLRAAAVVALVLLVQNTIDWNDKSEWQLWGIGFFYVALLLFTPVATVGALRFQLSRTDWRGIRFSFRGRAREYAPIFFREALWLTLSLGFYYPYFAANTKRYLVGHTYLGDRPFAYDGRGGDLIGPYARALALAIPTLGFFWAWMHARQENYDWAHTTLGEARFASTVTGGGLCGLWWRNLLLLMATFGLAWPWAKVRSLRYRLAHLSLVGPLNMESLRQDERLASAAGEELGEAMGTFDGGFGF